MHASSSSKCTLTTTLTLIFTKIIPVVPVTPSHTASKTGIPEPSSYPLVPPPPLQPLPLLSYMPTSAKSEETPTPATLPTGTTLILVDETSAASSALVGSSPSAAPPAVPTSKSSIVHSDGSNTHASHGPVQSASIKPISGSATTVVTSAFSGTGTATRTGTGSYVPSSSTPLFTDAADVVGVPGVMGWAVLFL